VFCGDLDPSAGSAARIAMGPAHRRRSRDTHAGAAVGQRFAGAPGGSRSPTRFVEVLRQPIRASFGSGAAVIQSRSSHQGVVGAEPTCRRSPCWSGAPDLVLRLHLTERHRSSGRVPSAAGPRTHHGRSPHIGLWPCGVLGSVAAVLGDLTGEGEVLDRLICEIVRRRSPPGTGVSCRCHRWS